jgi:hypothetical protein
MPLPHGVSNRHPPPTAIPPPHTHLFQRPPQVLADLHHLADGGLERAQRLAQRLGGVGEPLGAEHHQRDDGDEEGLGGAHAQEGEGDDLGWGGGGGMGVR